MGPFTCQPTPWNDNDNSYSIYCDKNFYDSLYLQPFISKTFNLLISAYVIICL